MMQSKMPKSGLAAQMRKSMKVRAYFTAKNIQDDLKALGFSRAQITAAISEFLRRGEIEKISDKRNLRQKYRYNTGYKSKRESPRKEKVIKSVYVSNIFTVKDLERLSGQSQNYINKILRKLKAQEYIQIIGQRSCAHGRGIESIWRIMDRDKYRIEVM